MKRILLLIAIFSFPFYLCAQDKSTCTIAGKLLDKEMNAYPLPFANIIIKYSTGFILGEIFN